MNSAVVRLPDGAAASGQDTRAVVVVASGMAGAGVSLTAALLAIGAANSRKRVLLVDHAAGGESFVRLFGVRPFTAPAGGRMSVRPLTDSLALAVAGIGPASLESLIDNADPDGTGYDLVVIDGGSRLSVILSACAARADALVAVTRVDRISLTATYALTKVITQRLPSLFFEVLVNRQDVDTARAAYDEVEGAAGRFLRRDPGFAGSLPDDDCLRFGLAAGMDVFEGSADAPIVDAAGVVVDRLLGQIGKQRAPQERHHFERTI